MKKNFTNPEIKITLFNRELIRTSDGNIQLGGIATAVPTGSTELTNYEKAGNWLLENDVAAQNIFSYKN